MFLGTFDRLTGVLSKDNFYGAVKEILQVYPGKKFELLRTDIERFKIINEIFGEDAGDRLLRIVSQSLQKIALRPGAVGRLHSDHFVIFYEAGKKHREDILQAIERASREFSAEYRVIIDCGIYCIHDREMPVSVMCDHANLALKKAKGNYLVSYGEYDEGMGEALRQEQFIMNAMEEALSQKQFKVWLQPKFELEGQQIVGAEALVRWEHPQRGLIQPSTFIPVFERNGFVFQLDSYIWEETCRLLAKWKAAGLDPLPVSVNISRVDVYNTQLCDVLLGLIRTYDIEPELLELEITESAYTDNANQIIGLTDRLRKLGFTILMDDFGSGYSSLNMLKEVSVDVLKLDLRFLSSKDENDRGGNILNSVVRMAKWLNLQVIAEGVETKAQADFLRNIGCRVVQGYYFSRPLPVAEYEALVHKLGCNGKAMRNRLNPEDTEDIWNPHTQYGLIFNNESCGIAMVELSDYGLELLRGNDGYFRLAAGTVEKYAPRLRTVLPFMPQEERQRLIHLLETCAVSYEAEEKEMLVHYLVNGKVVWIDIHVTQIMRDKERAIFYLFLHDVTNLQEKAGMLQDVFDNFPGGIGVYELRENDLYVRYMSPAILDFNGITEISRLPQNARVAEFCGEALAAKFAGAAEEAFRMERDIYLELPLEQADGTVPLIEIKGNVRQNQSGEVLCYVSFRKK